MIIFFLRTKIDTFNHNILRVVRTIVTLYIHKIPCVLIQTDVLAKLNSTYVAKSTLTRWTLTHQFLPQDFERTEQSIAKFLSKADPVCLLTDAWHGLQKRNVINVLLSTPVPFLVSTIYTTDNTVSEEYQCSQLTRVIAEMRDKVLTLKIDAMC